MIRRTIENLRERPRDERIAFAATVALGVVIVLFLGWIVFFFRSIRTAPAPLPAAQTQATTTQNANPAPFHQSTVNQGAQVQLNSTSTPPAY